MKVSSETAVNEIVEAMNNERPKQRHALVLRFPCEVHQTSEREVTIELKPGPQMFTDEFFEGLVERMGTSRAKAFVDTMERKVIRDCLLAEID